jgi:hypothetical protein
MAVQVVGCRFTDNSAVGMGAGIAMEQCAAVGSLLRAESVLFHNNSARRGAGVYLVNNNGSVEVSVDAAVSLMSLAGCLDVQSTPS